MAGRALADQWGAEWRFDSWLAEAEHMQGDGEAGHSLPGDSQDADFVRGWMQRHGAPGTIVVVRHIQLGLYEYLLDEVRRVDLRLKRIYLADHGVFRLNGEYLAPPRGRFGLLAPIAGVLEAAVQGHSWMNGRPAFHRPLSARERTLIDIARRQEQERD